MQWTCQIDELGEVTVDSAIEDLVPCQVFGDDAGILPHPVEMDPGVRVSRFSQLCQGEDCQVTALER